MTRDPLRYGVTTFGLQMYWSTKPADSWCHLLGVYICSTGWVFSCTSMVVASWTARVLARWNRGLGRGIWKSSTHIPESRGVLLLQGVVLFCGIPHPGLGLTGQSSSWLGLVNRMYWSRSWLWTKPLTPFFLDVCIDYWPKQTFCYVFRIPCQSFFGQPGNCHGAAAGPLIKHWPFALIAWIACFGCFLSFTWIKREDIKRPHRPYFLFFFLFLFSLGLIFSSIAT